MSQIEQLESAIDIVDLVKKYTNIKKAGANYKALCPFPGHNEKTPSFIISPAKQIAHCFGCRRGGGPLKFIMDVENCEFREAMEILSSMTGIALKGYDREKEVLRKNIYGLLKDIVSYYKNTLENHPNILEYLYQRGIDKQTKDTFSFGYSDSGVDLYRYLVDKGYSDELIVQSNVFLDLKSKKDKFIGRVIFPIQNIRGDFVALAGRILDVGEPKYLNSPASSIYDKSSILYGLYQARGEISKKDFIIITEGYMDMIALYQAGFKNSVCVSGVALTEKHISVIKKLTSKIYLCFDGDGAGQNATKLAIEILKNKDLEVKIILLEGGKDPDEFLKSGGDFVEAISKALSPIGYHMHFLQKTQSLQDTKEMLKTLLSLVKNYKDNVEKDFYLKEISKKLDISLEVVFSEFNKTKFEKRERDFLTPKKTHFSSEEVLIGYLLQFPDKIDFVAQNIPLYEYISLDLKNILENGIDVIHEMEIEKQNNYLLLSQNTQMLEIQAGIDGVMQKNEDAIQKSISKTLDKFNQDLLEDVGEILKQKIASGEKDALIEYQKLLKLRK